MKTTQFIFSILLPFVATSIVQAQQSIDEIDFVINSVKKMTSAQRAEGTKLFDKFELTKGWCLRKFSNIKLITEDKLRFTSDLPRLRLLTKSCSEHKY